MSNPVLGERSLKNFSFDSDLENGHAMSINGTILKTCFLGLMLAVTFAYTWYLQLAGFGDKVEILTNVGGFGGFILALFICFGPKNNLLAITTPLYALCEGLFLGSFSALANKYFPGVVSQAALGTIIAFFGMFILYTTKLVKCTDTFRMVVVNSTFAICGIYILQFILGFFHMSIPGLFSNSLVGIGFSIVVVAVASFNLILDFDFIEQFSGRANSYFEWYGGFALLVTIVWLYIEMLNLLLKIQSKN